MRVTSRAYRGNVFIGNVGYARGVSMLALVLLSLTAVPPTYIVAAVDDPRQPPAELTQLSRRGVSVFIFDARAIGAPSPRFVLVAGGETRRTTNINRLMLWINRPPRNNPTFDRGTK